MTYLKLSLLSFSLAALMLGCSQESNDEDPLVPEIKSITIEGTDKIHALAISADTLQLIGRITYTDETSSTTYNELDWDSNDSSVISVHNGLLEAHSNHGTVAISATYRDKIFSSTHTVSITPVTELNITSTSTLLTITNTGPGTYTADTNDSGPHQIDTYGIYDDGNVTSKITSNITWISSDTNVSSITNLGALTLIFDANATSDLNVSFFQEVNATVELNVTVP